MTDNADLQRLAEPGRHAIPFNDRQGNDGVPITLNAYRAESHKPDGPTVFVQHGMLRNGDEYRDFWIEAAERYGLLVVAPTFSNEHYPEPDPYNNGWVFDAEGVVRPRPQWTYAALAHILARLREAGFARGEDVRLFGHSAGGQFAHRFLSLERDQPFGAIIASNPGWYSLPTLTRDFPEGLGGLDIEEEDLARLLAFPLVILAGEEDSDTQDPHLPQQAEALRQGPHRYARAGNYFAAGEAEASRLGVAFNWRLVSVPHIGHDGRAMSAVAARYWFEGAIPDDGELRALSGERSA